MSVGSFGGIVNMDSGEGSCQIHEPAYSVLGNKLISLLENQESSAAR